MITDFARENWGLGVEQPSVWEKYDIVENNFRSVSGRKEDVTVPMNVIM
jgi:hypothetical protein